MDLAQVLAREQVSTLFQPIVDLDADTVVAYEALTRGPVGALEDADALFEAARREGQVADLDELCRTTALRNAIAVGITDPVAVFVNVEPEVIDVDALEELMEIARTASDLPRVILEITERAISARPAELLASVRRLRRAGWQFALDDVGATDMPLAFMSVLRPDIIKLDLSLVQGRPGPAVAGIMNAVNAYAGRSGALLLAEGIETDEHLGIARSLGARLGQGWLFGKPTVTPSPHRPIGALALPSLSPTVVAASPFDCLPPDVPLRRSTKPSLMELSKHLEQEAMKHGSSCIVASAFQFAGQFTPATAERYQALAALGGFVAVIAHGLHDSPAPGVRGSDLAHDDPLTREWDVVVLTPHFAAALLARDLGDDVADDQRRFEFALTYDRDVVAGAAETLLSRVSPSAQPALAETSRATSPDVLLRS